MGVEIPAGPALIVAVATALGGHLPGTSPSPPRPVGSSERETFKFFFC